MALALAARGCTIDLFDREMQPVTQASLWNEGKIHLGFTYAKDRSGRTADILLRGALHFDAGLQRLTGRRRPDGLLSAQFRYLVHRTSQLSADQVAAHFAAVAERYKAIRDASALSYFDQRSDVVWERMSARAQAAEYGHGPAVAAFRTAELSVDPHAVAQLLRQALAEQPRIRFHAGCHVARVALGPAGSPSVVLEGAGAAGPYDHVVNALWQERLRVDAALGLHPERPWLHRYKLAVHLTGAGGPPLPSTTVILGEYGDVVEFGGGRRYLSWYPACKLAQSSELQPPDLAGSLDDGLRSRTLSETLAALAAIVPPVGLLDLSRAAVRVEGGYIFAWGRTGIADPASELHGRAEIGIRSDGRYHSVDTGKYGMAPYFAEQLAERICGASGRTRLSRFIEAT